MTRWAMYANTPLDATVKKTLYPALRENIKGCNEKEAVERLLNWVQTAFVYAYTFAEDAHTLAVVDNIKGVKEGRWEGVKEGRSGGEERGR